MENPIVQTPSPAQQPQPVPINSHPTNTSSNVPVYIERKEQKSPFLSISLIIGFLLILVGVAGGAYYFGYNKGFALGKTGSTITPQAQITPLPNVVIPSSTPIIQQSVELPPIEQWITYSNTQYKYAVSYPPVWKVTSENYGVAAGPMSNPVNIFNPADSPETSFYSGMTIEYVGMVQGTSNYQQVEVNGVVMYKLDTSHGSVYYVIIPDTDQYLMISGASGSTANEVTNEGVQKILASFKFTP